MCLGGPVIGHCRSHTFRASAPRLLVPLHPHCAPDKIYCHCPRTRYLPPTHSLSAAHALAIRRHVLVTQRPRPHCSRARYPPPTGSLPGAPAPAARRLAIGRPRARYQPPTRSLSAAHALVTHCPCPRAHYPPSPPLPPPVPTIPVPYALITCCPCPCPRWCPRYLFHTRSMAVAHALDGRRPCTHYPPPVRLIPAPCALVAGCPVLNLCCPLPRLGSRYPHLACPMATAHALVACRSRARSLPRACSLPTWSPPYVSLARILVACRPPYVCNVIPTHL
jgi:hypothetical protein